MKKEAKKRWVEALLSEEYRQGKDSLCTVDGSGESFCCLGVLLDIEYDGDWVLDYSTTTFHVYGVDDVGGEYIQTQFLPSQFRDAMGISDEEMVALTNMNDTGETFASIAGWIEESL